MAESWLEHLRQYHSVSISDNATGANREVFDCRREKAYQPLAAFSNAVQGK